MQSICNKNRTKIVATVGPASSSIEVLEQLMLSGATVFRINFSHGDHDSHKQSIRHIRTVAEKLGISVAILGDLQGPKIRIGDIEGGKMCIAAGQTLVLDSSVQSAKGSIPYQCDSLIEVCHPGRILMLDDGRVQLKVTEVSAPTIITEVIAGTELSSKKGLNLLGGGLAENALSEKDEMDINFASEQGVDYLCVSFPVSSEDIKRARELLTKAGSQAKVIAKIERAEVVESQESIDAMIIASDGVMVARGDLAVEVGFEAVTSLQKQIVQRARSLNKPVIVATQMMESMIDNPIPTRAEVSDVANAVFDYADAVMLSGETAVGNYPQEVVKTVYDVVLATEQNTVTQVSRHRVECDFELVDESIAMAAMYLSNHFKSIKAIVCLTASGSTALWMSRIKTHLPMVAMSNRQETLNRVALYKGFLPCYLSMKDNRNNHLQDVVENVKKLIKVKPGDYIAVSYGDIVGVDGHTNTLKILSV